MCVPADTTTDTSVDALHREIRRDTNKWATLWGGAVIICLVLSSILYPSIVKRISDGMHISALSTLAIPLALVACVWRPMTLARLRYKCLSEHRRRILRSLSAADGKKDLINQDRPHELFVDR